MSEFEAAIEECKRLASEVNSLPLGSGSGPGASTVSNMSTVEKAAELSRHAARLRDLADKEDHLARSLLDSDKAAQSAGGTTTTQIQATVSKDNSTVPDCTEHRHCECKVSKVVYVNEGPRYDTTYHLDPNGHYTGPMRYVRTRL